jgi:hypothetical protein
MLGTNYLIFDHGLPLGFGKLSDYSRATPLSFTELMGVSDRYVLLM